MIHVYKGKAKYIWVPGLLLLSAVITVFGGQKFSSHYNFHNSLTVDTLPKPRKKIPQKEDLQKIAEKTAQQKAIAEKTGEPTLAPKKDTTPKTVTVIDTFNIKYAKEALDAPITYHADDSMVLQVPEKKILLYGKTNKANYKDNELTAPVIQYDQKTNLITAHLLKDSMGNVVSYASFKQGDFASNSDSLKFNLISGKGQTKGTYFTQNEMFVYAEVSKKVDSNTIYAKRTRFTTCNLDTPHFAFVSNKVKFINQQMAFTGPVHPEFEGVPVPIVLPFGIYPLRQGRHSGILAPTFTANEQLGLALEGLGYYKVLSDYWDMTVRGTLYSYGGWTANISPRYYKRYRYQGNFSLNINHVNIGLRTDKDFSATRAFNIQWRHSQDNKSRPGVTFSASVDAGSNKFNRSLPNSPVRNFNNQLQSSITYAKVWKDRPYNISVSANHNQNTLAKTINFNLPDVSFNVNTLYPFRRKEAVGELRWYENLGIALNTNARSLSSLVDTAGDAGKQLAKNFQWGARHSVPITLSLPQLGPFTIAPVVTYEERWFHQQFRRTWDSTAKRLDTTVNKGFYAARDMSFGINATTRIFGMFGFRKGSRIQAIRHEIRPSIGLSYKPNMNRRSNYSTQVDTFKTVSPFNLYDNTIFSGFGPGRSGSITFGIDNIVQMKVRSKTDTSAAGTKKVTLIDGLSVNSAFDMLADSFGLQPLSFSFRTNLFDKFNITAGATSDPYIFDKVLGRRVNKLVWSKKPFSLGNFVSGQLSLQSRFQGGSKGKKNNNNNNLDEYRDQVDPVTGRRLDDAQQEAAYIRNNPGEFADFSIPWSLSLNYSLRFNRTFNSITRNFKTEFFQDVSFNGDINLTPKWKLGMQGSYNFTNKEVGLITMFLSREMHCWQMSINATPIGAFRSFNITISPKSGLLRDLRINRTRYFFDL